MAMPDELATGSFWKAAGIRAVRSFCQALIALAGVNGTALLSASWLSILVASAGTALMSILTSIVVGIPEVPQEP